MITTIKEYSRNRRVGKYIEEDGKTYDVDIYYSLGGVNWFTGNNEGRGFYLSVSPVELTMDDNDNVMWRSTILGSGIKQLVVPLNRYNSKRLERCAKQILDNLETHSIFTTLFEHVKSKQPA